MTIINDFLNQPLKYKIRELPETNMISSTSFSENGCYKEPRTIAGITSKGAKQSDLFYT